MLRAGDTAPDFELPDQDGALHRLSDLLKAGPVVLFFYPMANTSGCTAEACHFRDRGADFSRAGAQRVGISRDSVAKQKSFSSKHTFDYPLLSDRDGAVAEAYGVRRGLLGIPLPSKRVTFVIGRDSTILGVIASETNMQHHGDEALALLETPSTPQA